MLGLIACLDMDLIKLVLSATAPVETENVMAEFVDVFIQNRTISRRMYH